MYNESYDDYIRSILGYPNQINPMNDNMIYTDGYTNMPYQQNNEQELESCYPEIYKIIYPMVNKACMSNTRPVTKETIDSMADEIYAAVENNNEINININLQNEITNVENRNTTPKETKTVMTRDGIKKEEIKIENRGEDRQFRNRGLQDLIKILLIRELLNRPNRPGPRPPMPPPPPRPGPGGRPPFPGGPGPVRPPIMPRAYDNSYYEYNDLYENF